MDIHAHGGKPAQALIEMRDWLANVSRRKLPSGPVVRGLHESFLQDLPALAAELEFEPDAIPYVDFERIVASCLVQAPAPD